MKHYPKQTPQPEQELSQQTPCQCPYGQPRPRGGKGTRTLIVILIGIASAFVIGFGGYAIFLSVQQHLADDNTQSQGQEDLGGQEQDLFESAETKNTVGTGTDPSFSGLSFHSAAGKGLSASQIFEQIAPSVVSVTVTVDEETYRSSGVILTKDGYALTTASSIGYSRDASVTARTSDNKKHKATVVGYDSTRDLAVLKLEGSGFVAASIGKADTASVGDPVYTVTTADQAKYSGVLTKGILSASNRYLTYDSVSRDGYFQTDAAVSDSGTGGALVNEEGQVIGLTISANALEETESGSYGLALEQVSQQVTDLIQKGYVGGRTRLGIVGSTLTKEEAKRYGVPQGVIVLQIAKDGAFAATDVQEGDIITQMDGTTVTNMAELAAVMEQHKAGDSVEVTLYRVKDDKDGESYTVTITLKEDSGQTQR
ncbi:MAG: trypsin-like peptidase domain-containing protein [Oscillospiraceae bacterium]|nr:trypsin-like peptidase domain-containing protein [Oscillospiraceae bacterium]